MNSSNDIQVFNSLFNEYYRSFVCFALGYLKEKQTAEDIVSEAFTIYWEKKSTLNIETNPPAYILTIIKNRCLNHLKHSQIRQKVSDELRDHSERLLQTKISTLEACDPDFLFSEELRKIIDNTLEKLPLKTRQIFSFSRDQGLSYKEIAIKTKLSQKAVEFHISKALQMLRISLRGYIALLILLYFLISQ